MILNKQKLQAFLPDSLDEFDLYQDKPFAIFENKNFLDVISYKKLAEEIYKHNDLSLIFDSDSKKKAKLIDGSNVNSLTQGVLKDLSLVLLSNVFFDWFKRTHLIFFKKGILNIFIRNPRNFFFKILKKLFAFTKIPFFFYYISIEISSMKKNSYLPPHTDHHSKRLSFVFYIPNNTIKLTQKLKKELGTVFWEPKEESLSIKSFKSTFLKGNDLNKFYKNYKPILKTSYEPNKIVGFIKSDNSWHSVEKIKSDYDRRNLVINVSQL